MIDSECLLVENTNGVFYSILIVSCFTNKHKKTCRQKNKKPPQGVANLADTLYR